MRPAKILRGLEQVGLHVHVDENLSMNWKS